MIHGRATMRRVNNLPRVLSREWLRRSELPRRWRGAKRALGLLTFPANFMLVAAMTPCPRGSCSACARECSCTPPMVTAVVRMEYADLEGPH